jgi:methylenetetrahydrofolate reductase (NADPH)
MAHISIELVPRSKEALCAEIDFIRQELSSVGMVNVPDLLRFDLRSWDACELARERVPRAVPHLRAMDFPLDSADQIAALLTEKGLNEVLVVRGDPPQNTDRPIYPTSSAALIRGLKEANPRLKVYGGFDPYCRGMRDEIDRALEKLAAGADALFTQPLFDLRFMDICAELLSEAVIYWGVSPVLSMQSRRYWEVKNRAFFPDDFELSLDWNRAFATRCLDWAEQRQTNLYFMPIRVDLKAYLSGLL